LKDMATVNDEFQILFGTQVFWARGRLEIRRMFIEAVSDATKVRFLRPSQASSESRKPSDSIKNAKAKSKSNARRR
jgi:hypothetical protein